MSMAGMLGGRGGYLETTSAPGAPAFCVHAGGPAELAAQIHWQQAADEHAPAGCSARR